MKYYVYWHPLNQVPKGTDNPLIVLGPRNPKSAAYDVKQTLEMLYPKMHDFVILDGSVDAEAEKSLFEKFLDAGQSKNI